MSATRLVALDRVPRAAHVRADEVTDEPGRGRRHVPRPPRAAPHPPRDPLERWRADLSPVPRA